MKEYIGMVGVQMAQVLQSIVSKAAMADGMTNLSFVFYSNALASLVILPLSLIFHRSAHRPPLTFFVVCGFIIMGLLGVLAQIFAYTGTSYSSATLATTLFNLVAGFTFILAILCRMEPVDLSTTTLLKFIGVVVTIAGAIIATLYKGPSILSSPLESEIYPHLLVHPSTWVLGGIFVAMASVFASFITIAQVFVLRKYPAEMTVMFAYCSVCTILSALASFIVEADLSSFSLKSKIRLLSTLYSGTLGFAFPATVQAWCLKKRGPLFVVMFQPVGILISTFIGVIFLGDGVDLGSLLGSITIAIGFYTVMWGKAKEKIVVVNNGGSSKLHNEEAPLLPDVVKEDITCSST